MMKLCSVEPQHNEPLYNKVCSITNKILHPNCKMRERTSITKMKSCYSKHFCQFLSALSYQGSTVFLTMLFTLTCNNI